MTAGKMRWEIRTNQKGIYGDSVHKDWGGREKVREGGYGKGD